jgi:hypothetical protein
MRTSKPHWPSRSPLKTQRTITEHLISERALRNRLEEVIERSEQPDQLMKDLDLAIRESRIT